MRSSRPRTPRGSSSRSSRRPVYTDALVGDGEMSGDGAGLIDLTPKPGAEEPFIPPVPEEE